MKVLFHANTLNYRGTTVAITDYAKYNQEILGNESVITYCKTYGEEKDMGNEQEVVEALEKQFKVISYRAGDLSKKIDDEKADVAYFIKSGQKEGGLPPMPGTDSDFPVNCKTAVHAVFQFYEPHGDRYAYISEWLSKQMTNGEVPFVPHIVNLPEPNGDYRKALGIREDQIVIGRLGGYYTFDIPEVKEYIKRFVVNNDKYVFLFIGTEPFVDHPNVKFVKEIHSPQKKSNFINTCDAMLHARQRGESFGLSIAEFLSQGKPVMAWNGGHDKNHTEMLKDSGLLYNNINELNDMMNNIKSYNQDWKARTLDFTPDAVMKKFKDVFL